MLVQLNPIFWLRGGVIDWILNVVSVSVLFPFQIGVTLREMSSSSIVNDRSITQLIILHTVSSVDCGVQREN